MKDDCEACILTADVVPKSELSVIGVQNMALENTNVDLKRRLVIAEAAAAVAIGKASDMVSESKREVAREIFAEIDKIIEKHHSECYEYEDGDECDTAITYLSYLSVDIDELKKKYTEGE